MSAPMASGWATRFRSNIAWARVTRSTLRSGSRSIRGDTPRNEFTIPPPHRRGLGRDSMSNRPARAPYAAELERELVAIVGRDGVLTDEAELRAYDCDAYTPERRYPDAVVLPRD